MPLFAVPSVKSNSLGLLAGLCAFLIWGFLVVFWHMLDAVAPHHFFVCELASGRYADKALGGGRQRFSQPPRGADHVRQFLCGGVELVPVHMGHQYRTDP